MNIDEVTIVRTGVANVASVRAMFERLGARVVFATTPAEVESAAALVVPGVGSFAAGMGALERAGVADAIAERARRGDATLCICLGMQLLARGSDESPGVRGLGVVDSSVERLDGAPRLPHFGWNEVRSDEDSAVPAGFYYFAHTFAYRRVAALVDDGWDVAATTEGEPFAAAISRDGVLACQFHPELSGRAGERLVRGWLARSRAFARGGA